MTPVPEHIELIGGPWDGFELHESEFDEQGYVELVGHRCVMPDGGKNTPYRCVSGHFLNAVVYRQYDVFTAKWQGYVSKTAT